MTSTVTLVNSMTGVAYVHQAGPMDMTKTYMRHEEINGQHVYTQIVGEPMTSTVVMQSSLADSQLSDNDRLNFIIGMTPRHSDKPRLKQNLKDIADEMIAQWTNFRKHLGND